MARFPDPQDEPGDGPPEASLDAAESLRIIAAQRTVVARDTTPDGRLIFGVWGVAWLLGYLAMYLSSDESHAPAPWAGAAFAALLASAIVVTAVHTSRRSAGLRGESSRVGAMYGTAWVVCFIVGFALIGRIASWAVDVEGGGAIITIASNGISCLIVAALYMAGGAVWDDRRMFLLGLWIGVVVTAATVVGTPYLYLVMALAGGGGFLVAAVVEHVRAVRDGTPGRARTREA